MFIWRGIGIAAFILFAGMFVLSSYLFKQLEQQHALHLGITFAASGLLWLLFLKRNETNKRLLREAEIQLQQPELLDDKTRRRAELRVRARAAAEMFDHSHLFFIPSPLWHYVFAALSIIAFGFYFFG